MTYIVPDELLPYLEFIPEDMLSDVITDVLRAAIFATPVQPVVEQQFDMSQIVEQLKGLIPAGAKPVEHKVAEEEEESQVVITTVDTSDVDEDLADFVADFAKTIFK